MHGFVLFIHREIAYSQWSECIHTLAALTRLEMRKLFTHVHDKNTSWHHWDLLLWMKGARKKSTREEKCLCQLLNSVLISARAGTKAHRHAGCQFHSPFVCRHLMVTYDCVRSISPIHKMTTENSPISHFKCTYTFPLQSNWIESYRIESNRMETKRANLDEQVAQRVNEWTGEKRVRTFLTGCTLNRNQLNPILQRLKKTLNSTQAVLWCYIFISKSVLKLHVLPIGLRLR